MRRFFISLIILFIILSAAYSIIIPIFNAPDEPFHFEYMQFIAHHKTIPNQALEKHSISTEGFNPPLYYIINTLCLSLLSKNKASDIKIHTYQDIAHFLQQPSGGFRGDLYPPLNPRYIKWGRGTERNMFLTSSEDTFPFAGSIRILHILRIISVLFGALTIFFIFKTAALIFPDNKNIPMLAASLCALNPQFNFLSGSLNNDNLVIVWATLSIWCITKLFMSHDEDRRRTIALLGTYIGLGLITKVNIAGIAFVSLIALVMSWLTKKQKRLKDLSIDCALFVVPAAAVSGWYFVRNSIIYGVNDIMGWHLLARKNPGLVLPPHYRSMVFKKIFFQRLFTSFWGLFDWLTIPLPKWTYWIYGAISIAGIWGLIHALGGKKHEKHTRILSSLYLGAILITLINLIVLNFTFLSAQARLIFPVIACFSIFMAIGIERALHLCAHLLRVKKDYFVYGFIGLILGLNLYALIWIIYPIYR
ncbi:MAG: DUF2142 domain-containing protein [bacterium]